MNYSDESACLYGSHLSSITGGPLLTYSPQRVSDGQCRVNQNPVCPRIELIGNPNESLGRGGHLFYT